MADLNELTYDESPTVTNLGRLIARLALDDQLHRQFCADPAAVIAAAGLNAQETAALKAKDWERILKLLGPKPRPVTGGGGSQTSGDPEEEGG